MADIHPLRAWRYDLSQVGDLSDVTAPPYDVIDPDQQDALYKKHPCNVIRLILNREEPGDESPDERYRRAARFLRHWQSEGVLKQDREEAFYVYHQEFEWEGTRFVRRGFLGRLRLEEFGEGSVFPHEQTLSGPKADRLALTKACRMNLSPIFGLYPDPQRAAQEALEAATQGQTPVVATDDLGVIHRLWAVTDHAVVSRVREILHDRAIFIADGHHRYETALNYRNWLKSQGLCSDEAHPANFVLMMFVGMSDPGLAILPTHRLVSGLSDLSIDELAAALQSHFELERVGEGESGARQAWDLIQAGGGQRVFGFGTAADDQWLVAELQDEGVMERLAPEQSPEWRSLGVAVLHKLVIEHLLPERFSGAEPKCRYVHLLEEVVSALKQPTCQLACLVAPATIEHVRRIATGLEKMPPKSTYFYPKLLSGLVFNPLE
ncbi:MAG: DUF1015 domain-containing protein [Planctomycetes bacterium]|nr:DUF1015 domain-containing protein [Planctomycetota bacterium]